MDENLKSWFNGFENALEHMDQKERESLFCECGKNCANRWVLNFYRDLYHSVNNNLDLFFKEINSVENVKGEVIEPGKKYSLCFQICFCALHNEGYIKSPHLCECSRQSILYVFKSIMPDKNINVEKCSTILSGGNECKFLISLQ